MFTNLHFQPRLRKVVLEKIFTNSTEIYYFVSPQLFTKNPKKVNYEPQRTKERMCYNILVLLHIYISTESDDKLYIRS